MANLVVAQRVSGAAHGIFEILGSVPRFSHLSIAIDQWEFRKKQRNRDIVRRDMMIGYDTIQRVSISNSEGLHGVVVLERVKYK